MNKTVTFNYLPFSAIQTLYIVPARFQMAEHLVQSGACHCLDVLCPESYSARRVRMKALIPVITF
jgi:hypothetical protein